MVSQQVSHSGASLVWEKPRGWMEEKGSGMRTVTFFLEHGNSKADCSIIQMAGKAGGLENNVKRWMRQLGLIVPAEKALRKFIDGQKKITTKGGLKGVLVDMTTLLSGNIAEKNSGMVSVIERKDKTIFIKLFGEKKLLIANKEKFLKLCLSLKSAD
ncbi:hypothetical protein ACFL5V_09560 [Fibrobacterota bacterium]